MHVNGGASALDVVTRLQTNLEENWFAAHMPHEDNRLMNRMAFRSNQKPDKFIDTQRFSLGHNDFTVSRFFPGVKADGTGEQWKLIWTTDTSIADTCSSKKTYHSPEGDGSITVGDIDCTEAYEEFMAMNVQVIMDWHKGAKHFALVA